VGLLRLESSVFHQQPDREHHARYQNLLSQRTVSPCSELSQFVDLVVASVALTVLLAAGRVGISIYLLWVPVLLVLLVLLALACGILLAALALFFRDVKFIVEVLLTFGIFITPVFYDVDMFGERATLLLLTPLTPILDALPPASVVGMEHVYPTRSRTGPTPAATRKRCRTDRPRSWLQPADGECRSRSALPTGRDVWALPPGGTSSATTRPCAATEIRATASIFRM
jgi:hypothetical protein